MDQTVLIYDIDTIVGKLAVLTIITLFSSCFGSFVVWVCSQWFTVFVPQWRLFPWCYILACYVFALEIVFVCTQLPLLEVTSISQMTQIAVNIMEEFSACPFWLNIPFTTFINITVTTVIYEQIMFLFWSSIVFNDVVKLSLLCFCIINLCICSRCLK